jgi:hypothetical protein
MTNPLWHRNHNNQKSIKTVVSSFLSGKKNIKFIFKSSLLVHTYIKLVRNKKNCSKYINNWPSHNTRLHNSYSSATIIRVTKSRVMTHMGNMAHTEEKKNSCAVIGRKAWSKRDHLKGPVTDNRIILKHFLHSLGWCKLDSSDSGCVPVTDLESTLITNKVPKNGGNYWTTRENTVLSTGLGSTKLISYTCVNHLH